MAAEIHAAPDTAQRRTARRLAMTLGCELTATNELRTRRAAILARSAAEWGPALTSRRLMDLAKLDTRRRALRDLLADQLEATA